jgi:uncharacterized membrane protein YgcG
MKKTMLAYLLLISTFAIADERILSYHSDIIVKQDGWIQVTETIRVRAEQQQIRRGIYRDFPTRYEDQNGNDYDVRFTPLAVLRNGQAEDFNAQDMSNGVRTYFGSADRFIDVGEHTYTFRYEANRLLGFFDDKDELYWNVTGDQWNFPIDQASATVAFEFDVPRDAFELYGYTGSYGVAGEDYETSIIGGNVVFESTRVLDVYEGLTISVAWPKGLVEKPGAVQQTIWLLSDNLNLLVAAFGLIAMFSYYIPVWRHFGKDPEEGVIFARYEPPDGFSPASLRYIEKMHYDDEAMTAAVVSLAVKGYLRINKDDDDEHTLLRTDPGDNPPALATGEKELHDALFEENDIVILDDEYHARLGGAKVAHQRSLSQDFKNRYFKTNGIMNLPPIAIMITVGIISLNTGSGPTFFVFATLVIAAVVLVVFAVAMRRPTMRGRKLLDEMSGFREYLEIAEKDEMNLRNPPEKTPHLFEKYLPFALAMGVEQAWAERFTKVFTSIQGPDNTAYQPGWYNGSWNSFDMSSTTQSLSSGLGTAISSSVTPPGSSSGGGGGGFSGGGGGGGGGGGW